ncbi:sialic acid-binding Ig-like lectin 5 isoform X2 [Cavia porcellus]|uniref:sialic acid-binding Ig-like lectin 5 isoform X2 n=1 Tax=Cavia porcellus TaxID=10141 RepID=UPI0006619914
MLWLLLLPLLWEGSLAAHTPGFQLTVPESVAVQEGQNISIPCNVSYPMKEWNSSTPALGYWFKKGANVHQDPPVATNDQHRPVLKETRGRFLLLGDPRTCNCSLHIRDAQNRDTGVYFFRMERGRYVRYSYIQDQLCVSVMGTLESGHPGSITCEMPWPCEQRTPPTFSWIGENLTGTLGPKTPRSSVLTITPQPQDHGTNLTCQVTFPGAAVTVHKTVQLNVSYAPRNMTIQVFQGNGTGPKALSNGSWFHVQEGQTLHLVCAVDSNPPATLSWTRGSLILQHSQQAHHGVLELPLVEPEDDGKYVCRAQHRLGSLRVSVSLFVRSSLQLLGPWCSWETEGLHCSCSSHAWPAPSLGWWLGERLLEGNISNASLTVSTSSAGSWTNISLSLREELCSSLKLSCQAWNPHGTQSVTVLLLPEKPGPRTGAVQGAIGGAGVVVLLAVCLCFIFFMVKTYRQKLSVRHASGDVTHPVTSTVFLGHLNASTSLADSAVGDAPAHPTAEAAGEEQEPHYASLIFQGLRPWKPQVQEDSSTTVYSEIRVQK